MAGEWLGNLEEVVERAVAEIERLRAENERLTARLEDGMAAGGDAQPDVRSADWQAERAEVRERVERLIDTLAGLLE